MKQFKKPKDKSIIDLESIVLKHWKKNDIFKKSVDQRSENDSYVFYDGPPFISGLPHYGHILGSIAKDVVPRYWTMKGKKVERVWGWDAGGITVENKVQKELGIVNRRDIEAFGLEEFIKACYDYTSRISSEWRWYIDRIGRWVDMDNAYRTIDTSYMESVMWAFKQLYDKGLIYEGVRTSLYCTTCGTPVSNFEIAMDNSYKEVEDPAIIVKFQISTDSKFKGVNVLAWTTTPWTIPSNRALVLDKNAEYSILQFENQKYIVAKARIEEVFKNKKYDLLGTVNGSDLLGLKYNPPYTFYQSKDSEFKIYDFEGMANIDEGTGIVHSAPGFGEIDTEMGRSYDLTIMLTIDGEGNFVKGDNSENPFAGMYYKKADKYIIEDLFNRDLLFSSSKIIHRFPFHDRCNTNLIQRAQKSWFVDINKIRKKLLEENEDINWIPEHLKNGRFAMGITQAPDWGISRSRFWATPMPVWESDDGDRIVVASVKEIEELSGKKVIDLHRPHIDKITFNINGKEYKRIPEVLDSWFEAGSMPYAQIHYPFENIEKFEKNFPGDYIVEYIGQVRAWFYVMHVLSVALFGKKSFKNVISTGVLAGHDGRKMSKTYGNYTDPKEIIETVGGDALRLYLMSSPLMVGENANFDVNELKNKVKGVLNPLWNSVMFFLIYSELNKFTLSEDNSEKSSENILDKWILAKLNKFLEDFSNNLEKYTLPPAVRSLELFVDDLSNWFVRRSRDRISEGNQEALQTLYRVLIEFAKGSAPLIPFISESIYLHLNSALDDNDNAGEISVHLENYPEFNVISQNDQILFEQMSFVRDICSLGNSIRKQQGIPIRQPLLELVIIESTSHIKLTDDLTELIKEELNVREVVFFDVLPNEEKYKSIEENGLVVALNTELNYDLQVDGAARDLIREIQKLRKSEGVNWDQKITIQYSGDKLTDDAIAKYKEEIMKKTYVIDLQKGDQFKVVR